MPASQPLNVTAFIDRQPLSAFQVTIVVLCFLIVAVDGFDTAAIGFIAPAIRAEWQLTPAQLAPLFGAGLGGLMAGAFLFGPLADRFGRKGVLVLSVLCFGAASLASAWSPDLWTLVLLRFITGLGLGGAMPNAITLTSEFCPEKRRSFLVTTMFCGFTLGSALGGLASAGLIDAFGWRSVLVAGGVLPLGLAVALVWLLPESVRYLVMTGKSRERIVATLRKLAPHEDLRGATFAVGEQRAASSPVRHLFRPALLRGTLLFWLTFFMSLLVIYLLSSWLPTLLRGTGHSLRTAALVTTMFQVGGTVGAIALGWLMDRFNPHHVLATSYALAALGIATVGSVAAEPVAAGVAVFVAGFCISGSQVGANALSASFYPTDCRATGVSWANGVGRMGSVVGSVGGATMLSMGLGMPALFAWIGVPALIAGLSMFSLGVVRRERAQARLAV
ncbi:4-hydroxybenzoate transporter PcaK [Cupriavidus phytorum]|uniref:4-hydroxybenzoate transporter PcaK n=2 Tax=Cupriavidus TaxID=106589 RepID=A0A976ABJ0_9BURK|nr:MULTISPECIES: aromatic acid/H+ symport family MFS transporter [Cupriavidus]PZX23970.1 AAHS family 4-hydroxybenzoate transporter-like MFS transporter [Cupriavidus alkaliphilus]SOY75716.1 4-hydroxybenzoate transporter PcaK [Cupriavidus taiwanensis]